MKQNFVRPTMAIPVCVALLALPLLTSAQTSVGRNSSSSKLPVPANFIELAQAEVTSPIPPVKSAKAAPVTDAQITGALTLEDPKKDVITRSFHYTLALKASSLNLSGTATNDISETFSMNSNSPLVGPAIDFGVQQSLYTYQDKFNVGAGLNIGGAYFNQGRNVSLSSGYSENNVRLMAYVFQAQPHLIFRTTQLRRWQYEVGPAWSRVDVMQSGNSEFVSLNASLQTSGLSHRLNYRLKRDLAVTAEFNSYSNIKNTSSNPQSIQLSNNYQLGIKSIW